MSKQMARKTPLNLAVNAARPAIVVAVIFSLFINVLALVSPLYMLQVYDRVLTSRSESTLLFLTLIVVFLLLVYAALEHLRTQALLRGGVRYDEVLQSPVFASIFFARLRKGAGNDAQGIRDTDTIREFLTGSGLIAFCDVPWIPVFVVVSCLLHPVFGLIAVIGGLVIFSLALANEFATRSALNKASVAGMMAQNDVTATLRNSEVMRAMGMWGGLQRRWQERRDELIDWQATASSRGGGIMSAIKFSRAVLQTFILGTGAYLAIKGSISAGSMIAASILVGRALAPIEAAVGQWKTFVNARAAWARLQALFAMTDDQQERMNLPAPKGRLAIDSIVVTPPGSRVAAVRGVSFVLEPGTSLGLIGPSAAGKSSLARAIVGVWPAAMGGIRLDGFEIKQWDPEALGQHIGYLPQDVELFAGSIAENIARFRQVDSAQVLEAAQLAGVHEMIQQLPEGYDTQIGEGGLTLSGGQRQRIGLARCLYGKPALIVLDEPNASLDAPGEAALVKAVEHLKQNRQTLIFITHKTNILGVADKILMLNQGAVQLFGDRDEVLAKIFGGPRPVASQISAHHSQAQAV